MKDIRLNALANTLVRLLNIFFPLITTAYLSRILSKQLYGEFNIANTYLNWFIPFATLGVYNYGIREISKVKDNAEKLNTMFSTLFYISFLYSCNNSFLYYYNADLQQESKCAFTYAYSWCSAYCPDFLY